MTMTAEERADEITGGRPAEKVFAYRIAAAIRAAEQEAYERGKGIGRAEVVEEMIKQGLISRKTVDAIRARANQIELCLHQIQGIESRYPDGVVEGGSGGRIPIGPLLPWPG